MRFSETRRVNNVWRTMSACLHYTERSTLNVWAGGEGLQAYHEAYFSAFVQPPPVFRITALTAVFCHWENSQPQSLMSQRTKNKTETSKICKLQKPQQAMILNPQFKSSMKWSRNSRQAQRTPLKIDPEKLQVSQPEKMGLIYYWCYITFHICHTSSNTIAKRWKKEYLIEEKLMKPHWSSDKRTEKMER